MKKRLVKRLDAVPNYCNTCDMFIGQNDICPECRTNYAYTGVFRRKPKKKDQGHVLPSMKEVFPRHTAKDRR